MQVSYMKGIAIHHSPESGGEGEIGGDFSPFMPRLPENTLTIL
ncbi:MAG: hypothetical protein WCG61_06930 [Chlorobium sp.]